MDIKHRAQKNQANHNRNKNSELEKRKNRQVKEKSKKKTKNQTTQNNSWLIFLEQKESYLMVKVV